MSAIAVLDTSTKKFQVYSLESGGEQSTIKDFVTALEEALTHERTGVIVSGSTCVRVLCAAVGENCINICDKLHTVQYYLLDGKPWVIKTGIFSSEHIDVHIKDTTMENGNEAAIKMDFDRSYVKDLKHMFAKMTCSFFPNLHFVFEKRELENDRKMSEYNLTSGCVVSCLCCSARTRSASIGSSYVYISPSTDRNNGFDGLSPVWRRATPGLWLEGICSNKICVAYSRLVIMNQGFTDLDFYSKRHGYKCPMCYEKVIHTLCGFTRCEWMTVGMERSSTPHRPRVVRQDWQRLEDGHLCFTPNKEAWLVFKVCCRELNRLEFCALCMTSSPPKTMQRLPCGHMIHSTCAGDGPDCLQCAGQRSMTSYQNYFC